MPIKRKTKKTRKIKNNLKLRLKRGSLNVSLSSKRFRNKNKNKYSRKGKVKNSQKRFKIRSINKRKPSNKNKNKKFLMHGGSEPAGPAEPTGPTPVATGSAQVATGPTPVTSEGADATRQESICTDPRNLSECKKTEECDAFNVEFIKYNINELYNSKYKIFFLNPAIFYNTNQYLIYQKVDCFFYRYSNEESVHKTQTKYNNFIRSFELGKKQQLLSHIFYSNELRKNSATWETDEKFLMMENTSQDDNTKNIKTFIVFNIGIVPPRDRNSFFSEFISLFIIAIVPNFLTDFDRTFFNNTTLVHQTIFRNIYRRDYNLTTNPLDIKTFKINSTILEKQQANLTVVDKSNLPIFELFQKYISLFKKVKIKYFQEPIRRAAEEADIIWFIKGSFNYEHHKSNYRRNLRILTYSEQGTQDINDFKIKSGEFKISYCKHTYNEKEYIFLIVGDYSRYFYGEEILYYLEIEAIQQPELKLQIEALFNT